MFILSKERVCSLSNLKQYLWTSAAPTQLIIELYIFKVELH